MTPRVWRAAALLTILLWGGLEIGLRRSDRITDDWQGWRQADTQAIARNFVHEEFTPWKPRIDWRGDGPGYVEAELQVYTTLVAAVMFATGEHLWPGQLLSLIAMAVAAWLLFEALRRRFGEAPAYVALLALLATKGVVVIATSIQPDALAFAAYVAAFVAFRDYLDRPDGVRLGVWTVGTMLAGLIKPPLLELGLAQALLVLLLRPALLRSWRIWAAWVVILAGVGAHLLYARELYLVYGRTFGVLSGGDSKLPVLSAVFSPRVWFDLARFEVVWGVGVIGALAAAYRTITRSWAAEEVALAVAALASSTLALRYTSGSFGTHYHLPHVVLGAWLVARLAAESRVWSDHRPVVRGVAWCAIAALSTIQYANAVRAMRALPVEPETVMGELLARLAPPNALVVVRARAPGYEPDWHTVNNYEDPRIFYLSRTKGWVVPNDAVDVAPLATAARRGAAFYVHVNQVPLDEETTQWLERVSVRVARSAEGAVYELDPSRTK